MAYANAVLTPKHRTPAAASGHRSRLATLASAVFVHVSWRTAAKWAQPGMAVLGPPPPARLDPARLVRSIVHLRGRQRHDPVSCDPRRHAEARRRPRAAATGCTSARSKATGVGRRAAG